MIVKKKKKEVKGKIKKPSLKKKVVKKEVKSEKGSAPKKKKYIETIGRRKVSVARVRIFPKTKKEGENFIINKKPAINYFQEEDLRKVIFSPIEKTGSQILKNNKIEIVVKGGGKRGQADAIKLGIARAILNVEKKLKTLLKSYGFLTRDPRKKERKKFGFKKARKAPQWQKR